MSAEEQRNRQSEEPEELKYSQITAPEVPKELKAELSDIHNADTTKLAYIGDAVYEVYIRLKSAEACGRRPGDMNKYSVHYVKADSQAKAARGLQNGFMTDEETALFKRARNRTCTSHPRGSTPTEYKLATGFEALIGWLYVTGGNDRLAACVEEAVRIIDEG